MKQFPGIPSILPFKSGLKIVFLQVVEHVRKQENDYCPKADALEDVLGNGRKICGLLEAENILFNRLTCQIRCPVCQATIKLSKFTNPITKTITYSTHNFSKHFAIHSAPSISLLGDPQNATSSQCATNPTSMETDQSQGRISILIFLKTCLRVTNSRMFIGVSQACVGCQAFTFDINDLNKKIQEMQQKSQAEQEEHSQCLSEIDWEISLIQKRLKQLNKTN